VATARAVVPVLPGCLRESARRRPVPLVQALRPRQWPKNVLVLAAPVAAGVLFQPIALARSIATFWLFVAASSATYLVNDIADRDADRLHPVKRLRPVASGRLKAGAAAVAAATLAVVSVAGAFALAAGLGLVVLFYLAISTAYTLSLKRVPVVELACVGSGFALRAIAGGTAAGVPISPWFLMVASFGALLVVAGKREAETATLGRGGGRHRQALGAYPPGYLRSVRALAMSVTVTTYCLWAFQRAGALRAGERAEDLLWFELSIVPFLLGVLLLELALQKGRGGQPEELALSERGLQFCGLAWVGLLALGIYS
jgi:decaprenyl-phosphate phosphoribosyltransferase